MLKVFKKVVGTRDTAERTDDMSESRRLFLPPPYDQIDPGIFIQRRHAIIHFDLCFFEKTPRMQLALLGGGGQGLFPPTP